MMDPGQRVEIAFPPDHVNAQMNGMTGKVTHHCTTLPSGELYNVWFETLFGNVALTDQHLVAIL